MRQHLGELSDIEIVDELVEVAGMNLIDLGCGSGATARLLAERGATVVGVEPDPLQAQRNREAEPVAGLTLTTGRAEALHQKADSVDGALFFRSLHHVPADAMDRALAEAERVVLAGGVVVVLEPGIVGSHSALMRPFHNEDDARVSAQAALARAGNTLFRAHARYESVQHYRYESFDELVARFSRLSFNALAPDAIDVPAVRELFEAGRTADGYVFDQPVLIDVYQVG